MKNLKEMLKYVVVDLGIVALLATSSCGVEDMPIPSKPEINPNIQAVLKYAVNPDFNDLRIGNIIYQEKPKVIELHEGDYIAISACDSKGTSPVGGKFQYKLSTDKPFSFVSDDGSKLFDLPSLITDDCLFQRLTIHTEGASPGDSYPFKLDIVDEQEYEIGNWDAFVVEIK